jgi:ubiquitin C-terminal hydrolase
VSFPISNFNLKNHVASLQKELPLYDLFAICNHEGTLTSGHYTAFAKNRDNKQWYFFNDSQVMYVNDPQEEVRETINIIFPLKKKKKIQ